MTDSQRLEKALAKIEARKKRLCEEGVTEPSKLGYAMRDLIAPLFRGAVSLMYPRSGFVLLSSIDRRRITKLIAGNPVIYAITHRGVWDAARYIAYTLPHCYAFSGDEKAHYCTINELAFEINGVVHFDRDDKTDREIALGRGTKVLRSNRALMVSPEGVPNVYGREMLKLFPGIIKIALDTGAIIVPVGNELHILRDRHNGKIIGDINYMMYEDYVEEHSLFRPSDDVDLAMLHSHLNGLSYTDIVDGRKMDCVIKDGKFHCDGVALDLEDKLLGFLASHPKLANLANEHNKRYLIRCSVLYEYSKKLINSLNMLEKRMIALSDKINMELDKRHPITPEEREKNSREYVDYYLDIHAKVAKKGRSTAYNEIDRYINKTTDESIIESTTKKVLKGLELLGG